jgi:hypothetical protein
LQVVATQVYGAQSWLLPSGALSVCMPSQLAADCETQLPVVVSHLKFAAHSESPLQDLAHAAPVQT